MMMLAWTIYISFLGVLVLMLLPKGNARAARKVALLSAVGADCAWRWRLSCNSRRARS